MSVLFLWVVCVAPLFKVAAIFPFPPFHAKSWNKSSPQLKPHVCFLPAQHIIPVFMTQNMVHIQHDCQMLLSHLDQPLAQTHEACPDVEEDGSEYIQACCMLGWKFHLAKLKWKMMLDVANTYSSVSALVSFIWLFYFAVVWSPYFDHLNGWLTAV